MNSRNHVLFIVWLLVAIFFSSCITIESIPEWSTEKGCVIFSGARCCHCRSGGGHPSLRGSICYWDYNRKKIKF